MWSADPQAVKKLVFVASSNHRCRSRQIFGDAKDFCPNFPKLARKNYKGDLPKKSKKTSAFWFWAPFSSNQRTSNDSVKVVTPFCPDFHGFCPDFKGVLPGFSPNQHLWWCACTSAYPPPTPVRQMTKTEQLENTFAVKQ